jgi:molybdopterin biosynthesis enzyme
MSKSITIPIMQAVGMALLHDITEIKPGEFKGVAFKKGHIITESDIPRFLSLGKENIYVLTIAKDEVHENDAAFALAKGLMGQGVEIAGQPREGKINIIAAIDGLLKIDKERLFALNMIGEVMCATLHTNSLVKKGQIVGATRAIPLVLSASVLEDAVKVITNPNGVILVKPLSIPRVGLVITGNEVFSGRIKDAFLPVIEKKITAFGGQIVKTYYCPDDKEVIESRIRELIDLRVNMLITTGGMSVDPDDVTRFAIRNLDIAESHYGTPVLPGAMFMLSYLNKTKLPILSIPACGMYSKITALDIILPRILAGDKIGREDIAEMGHGGLCMQCKECKWPVCPFCK